MADTDGDLLDDYYESFVLGTSPILKDSDEDGTSDGEQDFDCDGLSNYEESVIETDPYSNDTDQDGLNDWEEGSTYQTNPLLFDTDEDGLGDGDEIQLGFNPLLEDTDGDGILDSKEEVEQCVTQDIQNEDKPAVTKVSVTMDTCGNMRNSTIIDDLWNINMMSSELTGLIGIPVDIDTDREFDEAILTFNLDSLYSQDRAALVKFASSASLVCPLGTEIADIETAVSGLYANGGTYAIGGLNMGIGQLTANKGDNERIIVLLCDGDISYNEETVENAVENGIKVYAVNVGYASSESVMTQIAAQTGGAYYYAATSDEIQDVLSSINGSTVGSVDQTDTDGDGLPDVYETEGMRIANGKIIHTDPNNEDTDGDGLLDGEEILPDVCYSSLLEGGKLF